MDYARCPSDPARNASVRFLFGRALWRSRRRHPRSNGVCVALTISRHSPSGSATNHTTRYIPAETGSAPGKLSG